MEETVHFLCNHKTLYGILHIPDTMSIPSIVVIIVTGGPQIRTGAHRLYVQLSRFLCEHNWASLRFDYEGLGDSEGEFVGFQYAGPSIAAAMSFLQNKFGRNLKFIFWSLCDGATAVTLYAASSPENISGLILCNPFAISKEGLARSTIRHYYIERFFNKSFWIKIISFRLDLINTVKSLCFVLMDSNILANNKSDKSYSTKQLPEIFIDCLSVFGKPIRIILSSDDIIAVNFQDEIKKTKLMSNNYKSNKITNYTVDGADHTFVEPMAKEQLFEITLKCLNEIVSLGSDMVYSPA